MGKGALSDMLGDTQAPLPLRPRTQLKWFTLGIVALVSVVAVMLGYDIGVMADAILYIEKDLNLTLFQKEAALGCLNFVSGFGAIFTSEIIWYLGSPRTVAVSLVLYLIGMTCIAGAMSFEVLFIGRLITGLGVGTGFAVSPQYIAEISPAEYRGILVSCFEIAINVGLVLGYVSGLLFHNLPVHVGWRVMVGVALPPALVCLVLMFWTPESPRWLYQHGHKRQAHEVLSRTCAEEEVCRTLDAIRHVVLQDSKSQKVSWSQMLFKPSPGWSYALLIGVGTAFFQQANGSEAAVYYVPYVLEKAGVKSTTMQLVGALVVGIFKTTAVLAGQFNLDRYGRRPILLGSISGCTLALMLLGISFSMPELPTYWTLGALCLFMGSFGVGVGPVTWVLASEVFPLAIRHKAMSLTMAVNRMTSGTIALTFLSLATYLSTAGAYWLFTLISCAHLLFTFTLVPETKGKTLEEVEEYLLTQNNNHLKEPELPYSSPSDGSSNYTTPNVSPAIHSPEDHAPLLQAGPVVRSGR